MLPFSVPRRLFSALLVLLFLALGVPAQQPVPAASGARILLLPRRIVSGERATLSVLDMNGRLTPGVPVVFSNGDKVTTDTTGRARFVAPLSTGVIYASIAGRGGRVYSTILSPADAPSSNLLVAAAPHFASLTDRFELTGLGFCGDADSNHVQINGLPGLILASSPGALEVLPPMDLDPGLAKIQVACGQKTSDAFSIVFLSLELDTKIAALAPGEKRELVVHVTGTTAKVSLEARNLAPEIADLQGGAAVHTLSSGGAENSARFQLTGKQRGNFIISIRLLSPLSAPRP